ncbi:hypothetical protein JMUB7531_29070 [Staphylococcus aureus]
MSRGLGDVYKRQSATVTKNWDDKQKTAYESCACLGGSEMCIRDSVHYDRKLDLSLIHI